jgi:acylphosphatase
VTLELCSIDGTLSALRNPQGFRKFVQEKAVDLGMTGDIMRTPHVNAIMTVVGTEDQHDQFANFITDLQRFHFVTGGVKVVHSQIIENRYAPVAFVIRPSE